MAGTPAALDSATPANPHGTGFKRKFLARRMTWLLFPAAFALPVLLYGLELRETTHYQFVWLMVPIALLLSPSRLRNQIDFHAGTSTGTWLWWGPAALLSLLGTFAATTKFGAIGALLWGAGAAYAIGGRTLMRKLAPIWCCLWLAIRPPLDLDLLLIRELKSMTALLADHFLDGLGVVHLLSGNVISIAGKQLHAEEACSGVQYLFTGWGYAWTLCLVWRHGLLRWLMLMLSVPFWMILTNAIYVAIIAILWTERRDFLWQGAPLLGLFVSNAVLIASTDCLLSWFFPRHVDRPLVRISTTTSLVEPKSISPTRSRSVFAAIESSLSRRGAALCGGMLLVLQVVYYLAGGQLDEDKVRFTFSEFGAAVLPDAIGPGRRLAYEALARANTPVLGTDGERWYYEGPGGKTPLALNSPFAGRYDLIRCDPAAGIRSRNLARQICRIGPTLRCSPPLRREVVFNAI